MSGAPHAPEAAESSISPQELRAAVAREETLRFVLGTYIVGRYAQIRRGLRVPAGKDLVVGMGARIGGSIVGASNVYLARGVLVDGSVNASLDVVVGAQARVGGDVTAGGNTYVLDGARVAGRLAAGGLARIVGGFVAGPVRAAGDIEVGGDAVLHEVRAGGRIRTLPNALIASRAGDAPVTDS
jgi:predicted acyltransferase (DUF342 family)